jgi:hypothetical protein
MVAARVVVVVVAAVVSSGVGTIPGSRTCRRLLDVVDVGAT